MADEKRDDENRNAKPDDEMAKDEEQAARSAASQWDREPGVKKENGETKPTGGKAGDDVEETPEEIDEDPTDQEED